MTPWEQYLEKKKEKRKAKKLKSKKVGKSEEETEDPEKPFSDDELPDGFDPDDPFFKTMQDEGPSKEKGKKNKKMDKKKGKKNSAKVTRIVIFEKSICKFFSIFDNFVRDKVIKIS